MNIVSMLEAETHFFEMIDSVIHGKKIVIAMDGKPVATLAPISNQPQRQFGLMKGKIKIAKDFDDPINL
jgi:antitoxin (DNA-binding transcriptional repressor) of toxin-antitoxin stability system